MRGKGKGREDSRMTIKASARAESSAPMLEVMMPARRSPVPEWERNRHQRRRHQYPHHQDGQAMDGLSYR